MCRCTSLLLEGRDPAHSHPACPLSSPPPPPPSPPRRCTACGNTKMSICQLQQAAQNITQLEARLSGSATSDGASSSSSSCGGSSGSGLSGGAVAGIAIGCAAAVAAVLSAAFFVYHRKVTAQLRQEQLSAAYGSGLNLAA